MCCSDHLHCCPEGTTCDLSAQTCNSGNGHQLPWSQKQAALPVNTHDDSSEQLKDEVEMTVEELKRKELENEADDIECPDKISTCPAHTTCCVMQDGYYGCCPMKNVSILSWTKW